MSHQYVRIKKFVIIITIILYLYKRIYDLKQIMFLYCREIALVND